MNDTQKLRKLADKARLFGAMDEFKEGEYHGIALVGDTQEGDFYEVVKIDTEQYQVENYALALAEFYANANPRAVLALLDRIAELEKDAARLDFLQTTNVDGEGLRYEVNCFVVDGENQFTIYDEVKEGFVSGEWSSDFRAAIDTAMQKD